jgi:hypothetical protein
MEHGYIMDPQFCSLIKKDDKLQMCTSYCAFKKITIKNNYPRPKLMIFLII